MIVHDCDQNSPEWIRARMGRPTASEFSTVLARGKGGGESLTRRAYLYRLAGEIITGEPAPSYSNEDTERGHAMEPEARDLYAFMRDAELTRVGFVTLDDGSAGASPDSLIRKDGALEIKTKAAHRLIECLMRDDFPPEHKAQCQGVLWICEREYIDLAAYWPKMPLVIHRAKRDEIYIRNLADEVIRFNEELSRTVETIRRYGMSPKERTHILSDDLRVGA